MKNNMGVVDRVNPSFDRGGYCHPILHQCHLWYPGPDFGYTGCCVPAHQPAGLLPVVSALWHFYPQKILRLYFNYQPALVQPRAFFIFLSLPSGSQDQGDMSAFKSLTLIIFIKPDVRKTGLRQIFS